MAETCSLTFVDEIHELKREIARRGWNNRLPLRMASELAMHLVIMMGGLAIYLFSSSFWVDSIGMLISLAGAIGVLTHTHCSSHYSTFKNRRLDEALVYFGFTALFGLSATYWDHKHVKVHHPYPNIYGIDNDIDLKPFFAFTQEEVRLSSNKVQGFLFRHQGWLFPIALAFNGFNLQAAGWKYLIAVLRDNGKRTAAHWIDLATLVFHYSCWIVGPCLFFQPSAVVQLYILRVVLMGYGLYAILAPGHFPAEAIVLETKNRKADFYARQLVATVNFRTGLFGQLFLAGIDHQIEHHLFPGVTHIHYPEVGKRLKSICEKHGYPFQIFGWWEAIWKSYAIFWSPKAVYEGPDAYLARLSSPLHAEQPD